MTEVEEAAADLARRLREYRQVKLGAAWLRERLEQRRDVYLPGAPERPRPAARQLRLR